MFGAAVHHRYYGSSGWIWWLLVDPSPHTFFKQSRHAHVLYFIRELIIFYVTQIKLRLDDNLSVTIVLCFPAFSYPNTSSFVSALHRWFNNRTGTWVKILESWPDPLRQPWVSESVGDLPYYHADKMSVIMHFEKHSSHVRDLRLLRFWVLQGIICHSNQVGIGTCVHGRVHYG